MTAPYFTGDNVPLEFTVTDDAGAVNPSAASVVILKPDNSVTAADTPSISGNTVTTLAGLYKAYFILTLASGERTHKVEFNVTYSP